MLTILWIRNLGSIWLGSFHLGFFMWLWSDAGWDWGPLKAQLDGCRRCSFMWLAINSIFCVLSFDYCKGCLYVAILHGLKTQQLLSSEIQKNWMSQKKAGSCVEFITLARKSNSFMPTEPFWAKESVIRYSNSKGGDSLLLDWRRISKIFVTIELTITAPFYKVDILPMRATDFILMSVEGQLAFHVNGKIPNITY